MALPDLAHVRRGGAFLFGPGGLTLARRRANAAA